MQNFEFYNPVKIIFGAGESQKVGEYTAPLGKNAMLVTYESHAFFNTLLGSIKKSLNDNGVSVTEFYKIQANPLLCHISEAVEICRNKHIDVVIALGGGSVMDSTKLIAAGTLYRKNLWKMFNCNPEMELPTETLPTVLIPTLPATSSEMNCIAVATNDKTLEKSFVMTSVLYSSISIMVPSLTLSLPQFQTASGGIDAISHILEAYFNGDQHSPVQDRTQEGLVVAIMSELKALLANPTDIEHRSNIMWASTLAWNGWMQAGINAVTPMHNMGHILSARFNVTHGVTLAIFMASFFKYTSHLNKEREARFALAAEKMLGIPRNGMSDAELADEFVTKFTDFMKSTGIPTTLHEVNISDKDFEMIADDIVRLGCDKNGYLPSIPPIGRDGIIETLKLAY